MHTPYGRLLRYFVMHVHVVHCAVQFGSSQRHCTAGDVLPCIPHG